MIFLTIYSMLIDDIRNLALRSEADAYVDSSIILCLLVYILDLVLNYKAFPNYRFKFFFFLDLISTISMLTDINWFNQIAIFQA